MKGRSLLLLTILSAYSLLANGQEQTCKVCNQDKGCYQTPGDGYCSCGYESSTHMCSVETYCTGNTCRGKKLDLTKGRPWIASQTLADDLSKVDETLGRMVSGLQRMIRKDPMDCRLDPHLLTLRMDGQEPAQGIYDPLQDRISLNYWVGDTLISHTLTFTSKEWKLESSGGEVHTGTF